MNKGNIVQVIGPVVDVEFPDGKGLPGIYNALEIEYEVNGNPTKLTLVTRLNGKEMQRSGTDLLIYSIPQIISFCSDFTPLSPGDIIATGTPEGVGHRRNPPVWMKPGDKVEIEIDKVGILENSIADG